MAKKPLKFVFWAAIAASFLAANYATQHSWPLWTITIAGAVSLSAVVAYILTIDAR